MKRIGVAEVTNNQTRDNSTMNRLNVIGGLALTSSIPVSKLSVNEAFSPSLPVSLIAFSSILDISFFSSRPMGLLLVGRTNEWLPEDIRRGLNTWGRTR